MPMKPRAVMEHRCFTTHFDGYQSLRALGHGSLPAQLPVNRKASQFGAITTQVVLLCRGDAVGYRVYVNVFGFGDYCIDFLFVQIY